ncbi:hypothetical protein ACFWAY_24450 [Rhodococcus sp. NPDC059968]|uniref:hypothetical protein n=1 Tax=Rhodococcus sp. NPDC059968 TaxID=3347017 RepID=UPI00367287FB
MTEAVADMGGLRRVDHPNDLQLDARGQYLARSTTTAEQHRDLMDLQLVEHTGLSARRATDEIFSEPS